ncbi:glycosyltransferase family 39 protein [Candidatus Uabimicrobium sp. HlEnr_7]|uniref:glycosyltransferase family 39 protein n=1 Tax=Candidatus Uabimicrobium helgolandensis TaxID=3095367 RepID=UPI003558A951
MIADTKTLYKKFLQYSPCFFIVFIALFLRFCDIEQSLWLDEVYSLERSGITGKLDSTWDMIVYIAHSDAHPPGYYLLLRFWASISQNHLWLKLLSIFLDIAGILFVYLIVLKITDMRKAFLCSLTLACSYFMIHYSQELRHYSLSNFISIFSTWCVLQAVITKKIRYFYMYLIATTLGFYTYYYLAFLFATHGTMLLFYGGNDQNLLHNLRSSPRKATNIYQQITYQVNFARWVKSQLVATLLFFPWLYYVLPIRLSLFGSASVEKRGSISLDNLYELLQNFFVGESHLGHYAFAVILLLFITNILLFSNKKLLWLYTLVLLPVCIVFVFPFKGHIFQSKHLLYTFPLLVSIIAISTKSIKALILFLCTIIVCNLYIFSCEHHQQKQLWHSAISEMYQDVKRGDVLCFNPYYLEVPGMYYYKKSGPIRGKEIVPAFVYLSEQTTIPRSLKPYIYFEKQHLQRVKNRNLWLVEVVNCYSTPRSYAFFTWCEQLFERVEQRSYPGSFGTIVIRKYKPRK